MAVTIRELARMAGVSNATVSLVLSKKDQGRVSAARREEILGLADKHGYRFNLAARGLAEGRTYRIAICLQGTLADHSIVEHHSLYERLGRFSGGIQSSGYSIEIQQVDTSLPPSEISRDLSNKAVDGFIFLGWAPREEQNDPPLKLLERLLFSLREKHIPAVASGSPLFDDEFTWTDVDRKASFHEATKGLIAEGHKKILFVNTDPSINADTLCEGYKTAMKDGLGVDASDLVFAGKAVSFAEAYQATREALSCEPEATALMIPDNTYCETVVHVIQESGKPLGKKFRLIGFGDTAYADRSTPMVSHYSLQVPDQVDFGLAALTQAIESPKEYTPTHQLFPPKYIPRST
jgi:DNA-binding LacI/PurR family transcriptional regulator